MIDAGPTITGTVGRRVGLLFPSATVITPVTRLLGAGSAADETTGICISTPDPIGMPQNG